MNRTTATILAYLILLGIIITSSAIPYVLSPTRSYRRLEIFGKKVHPRTVLYFLFSILCVLISAGIGLITDQLNDARLADSILWIVITPVIVSLTSILVMILVRAKGWFEEQLLETVEVGIVEVVDDV